MDVLHVILVVLLVITAILAYYLDKRWREMFRELSRDRDRWKKERDELVFRAEPLARDKTSYSFTGKPPTRHDEVWRNEQVEALRVYIQKVTGRSLRGDSLTGTRYE